MHRCLLVQVRLLVFNLSCKMFYVGGQRRTYLSRWKLIIQHYNAIRARLYNSLGLLEETKLALYTINQTTLVSYLIC